MSNRLTAYRFQITLPRAETTHSAARDWRQPSVLHGYSGRREGSSRIPAITPSPTILHADECDSLSRPMRGDAGVGRVRVMAHALHPYDAGFDPSPRDGERYSTIGIGGSVEDALAWARDSAPTGTRWLATAWSDLYGD